jgi:hypothetical protein
VVTAAAEKPAVLTEVALLAAAAPMAVVAPRSMRRSTSAKGCLAPEDCRLLAAALQAGPKAALRAAALQAPVLTRRVAAAVPVAAGQ